MAKRVTAIPATRSAFTAQPLAQTRRRRTAGYARVSTNTEEQESSFENQMRHYTQLIQSRPDWEFVGMYSDEGISGTGTARREGFTKMVQDALDGRIDLIITKSVSRFARNTVDSLTTIRLLKEKGVEVYFEEQNIFTFDSQGELLLTIMSSLAQEESHSISQNTKWGVRKKYAEGKVSLAYSRFMGYDKGPNGELVINPEQAAIVKQIFDMFLGGMSGYAIATRLTEMGVPTPTGKQRWSEATVNSMLQNEKYRGDALLQKGYTVDFLTKKRKKNSGEVQQFYVEGNHEAIIDADTFDQAQELMARRKSDRQCYSRAGGIYASKIKCGDCGAYFGRKVWHSRGVARKVVYQCNRKYKNPVRCQSGFITEAEVDALFVRCFNEMIDDKENVLMRARGELKELEGMQLGTDVERLENELADIVSQAEEALTGNGDSYSELVELHEQKLAELDAVKEQIKENARKAQEIRRFIAAFEGADRLTEMDENLWTETVDYVTVYSRGDAAVTFRNGVEIGRENR